MMKNKIYFASILAALLLSHLAQAQTPGTFTTSFGSNGYQWYDQNSKNQYGLAIATQPDGKVLLGAMHEHTADKYDWLIMRINTDGSLDNSFSQDGKYNTSYNDDDRITSIALQSNGKILLCGYTEVGNGNWDIVVERINPNGTLDNTFGTSGTVQLDRSFGAGDVGVKIMVDANDKIYIGGYMYILGDAYFLVHRLLPNGAPDSTFSLDGDNFLDMNTNGGVIDMDLGADGSVIVAGWVEENNITKLALVKFKSNGLLDDNFAGDGSKVFTPGLNIESQISGVALLPDGTVVAVGAMVNNGVHAFMVQVTPTGLLDGNFNGNGIKVHDLSGGAIDGFVKINRLASGKYIALAYTRINNIRKAKLVQLNMDGSIDVANYGSGTGYLDIGISNTTEYVSAMAVNNDAVYTIGNFDSGVHDDVFVTKSYINNPISITEYQLNPNAVKIFPNPATTVQSISVLLDDEINGKVALDVYSVTGACVYHETFYKASSEYQHPLKIRDLARGIYVVHITNGAKTGTQKLIIQ
jgi:uncharacterized delta-60 repeat protein